MEAAAARSGTTSRNLLRWVHSQFSQLSRTSTLSRALLMVAVVASMDYLVGVELATSIFYLPPIALVAWYVGRREAIAFCVLSGGCWFLANTLASGADARLLVMGWNASVRTSFLLITALLISEVKRAVAHEQELSRIDHLTGAANSRFFYEEAARQTSLCRRHAMPLTVVCFDVDGFKKVNDTMGHFRGDELLRDIAELLRQNTRISDVVARMGGDEFALLLPHAGEPAGRAAVGKLQEQLLAGMKSRDWPVTFSIGAVTYAVPPSSVDEMLKHADALMYTAKHGGKNRVEHQVISGAAETGTQAFASTRF
jgi:diguanylate cyclase (GGDEF)-like protein